MIYPTYDAVQMSAVRVTCHGCQRTYDMTKPKADGLCILCRQAEAKRRKLSIEISTKGVVNAVGVCENKATRRSVSTP